MMCSTPSPSLHLRTCDRDKFALFYLDNSIGCTTGGIPGNGVKLIGFLDGTLKRVCRPGGAHEIQRQVFDGHHRAHGLAFQSLVLPNGMIGHFYGPEVGRRHDTHLLHTSGLNGTLAELQEGNPIQYKVYGDAAYPIMSHVTRGFLGANLNDAQKMYNKRLASVRVSVEWTFGKIVNTYSFVGDRNLKIRNQPVAPYYLVAALLCNAHTCMYGSQTGTAFDIAAPTLEEYFEVA